jgi:hypothetical protein
LCNRSQICRFLHSLECFSEVHRPEYGNRILNSKKYAQYYKRYCFNGVRDEKLQTQTIQDGPIYRIDDDIDMVALESQNGNILDYRRVLDW